MSTLSLIYIALVVLPALVALYGLRRAHHRALEAAIHFAGRLASGDLAARLPPRARGDKLAQLYGALNVMAADMEQVLGRAQARNVELSRINRTLHLMGRCGDTLARAASKPDLLDKLCNCMVEEGGYPLVWGGIVAPTGGPALSASAIAGTAGGRFAALEHGWERGKALSREMREVLRDGSYVLSRTPSGETGNCGFASCLMVPLLSGGETLGAIAIYSDEPNAFNTPETGLLRELAGKIADGVAALRDARKRLADEQVVEYRANHDPLTGLANRTLFNDRLEQATLAAARSGKRVAVLTISLDRYRSVKVSHGHDACNALLLHVADSMGCVLREGDTLARLQGNEFAVVIGDLQEEQDVLPIAAKLLAAIKQPQSAGMQDVASTASIGVSLLPRDSTTAEELMRCASSAMANAIALGGNRFRFYAPDLNEKASYLLALEADLRRAIEQNELSIHYQARTTLEGGKVSGAEALVRWMHPRRGVVLPADFIPFAETSGLIVPLGAWVIREVCRQQRAWRDAGLPAVPVAIKLSERQFREEGLLEYIELTLQENALEAGCIGLEIAEATVIEHLASAPERLAELNALGLRLALDDFGTGCSSLSSLRHLPIDYLKIDRAYVSGLPEGHADAAIAKSIIDLAHNLGMKVVAEGVETESQAAWLRAEHCDEMQGYLLAPPLPAAEFAGLLQRHPSPREVSS